MIYHLDYETTSACDIGLGAYRYASDPSTRILMFAIAEGSGTPLVWDAIKQDEESGRAKAMLEQAIRSSALIYAHNAQFEIAVSHYRMPEDIGLEPPQLEQWRCTKSMALRAAIPASLAKAAEFLRVTDKDKAGKALIKIFSDQKAVVTLTSGKDKMKSNSPILEDKIPWDWTMTVAGQTLTVAEAWDMFREYCRQDVVVEHQVHQRLEKYELEGTELEGFLFDLRMNHRGIPVNREALETAKVIVDKAEELLAQEFSQITGLMPSQTGKVLAWLQQHGYPGDNLQASTMEQCKGSAFMTQEAQRALEIRSLLSFAAVKKIPAMLDTACPDNRMRGLFTWHGAQRTGRWTASGPQPQNVKKPTIKYADSVYSDLCSGIDFDLFAVMHGDVHEAIASCARNFIQCPDGQMLDLDLANIESRVAAFLAGCDAELDLYRKGKDAYKALAADVFSTPYENVTKDQRFVGKVGVLSLVFQVGAKKFWETCALWGQPIDKSLACKTVRAFRESRPEFPRAWDSYERAIIKAVKEPNKWFDASPWVKVARSTKKPFDRLLMRLPSGRDLVYPLPEVKRAIKRHKDFETGEVREWETDDFTFYGANQKTNTWGRVGSYAGSFFQSSVQATARDIMMHGCITAEKAGHKIFAVIHDQALAEEGSVETYTESFTTVPSWLPADFPLGAEGGLVPYYKKD